MASNEHIAQQLKESEGRAGDRPPRRLTSTEAAAAWRQRFHQADPEAERLFADLGCIVSEEAPPKDFAPKEDATVRQTLWTAETNEEAAGLLLAWLERGDRYIVGTLDRPTFGGGD
jgi:hypothetical protein